MKETMNMIPCYMTKDYGMFKHLVGNRGVDLQRVAKIKKSIEERYVKSAITVNKNYEVIDGQGRLAALTELELPVYYVIDEEATLDDCVRMNINSTPWNASDYIYSGRDRGIEDYVKLASLLDRYKLHKNKNSRQGATPTYRVPLDVIMAAADGSVSAGNMRKNGKNYLENGLFKFLIDYDEAVDALDFVSSLHGIAPNFGISSKVLLFAKRTPEIDEIRLRNQITIHKNTEVLPSYINVDECVLSFEAAYNYRLAKSNKIDMRALYNNYRLEYGGAAGKSWVNTRGRK